MHPFYQLFRNTPSLGEGEVEQLLGPPEAALPLLADADLNLRVAEDHLLQLPPTAEVWVHKAGGLTGLYSDKPKIFNPNWKTPKFPNIHLRPDLCEHIDQRIGITAGEKRRFKLCLPARFFPNSTKYFPLEKGIKNYYPQHTLTHFFLTANYLWNLWESGVTYLRETQSTASFNGQLYPWEQKQQYHGAELVHTQPHRVFAGARNDTRHIRRSNVWTRPLRQYPREGSLARRMEPVTGSMGPGAGSPSRRAPGHQRKRPGNFSDLSRRQDHQNPSWQMGKSKSSKNKNKKEEQGQGQSSGHYPTFARDASDQGTTLIRATQEGNSSFNHQSCHGASTNAPLITGQRNPSTFKHDNLEREVRQPADTCPWLFFLHTDACGKYCLKNCVQLLEDWGECHRHGQHLIRTPRTPRRISGGVFLVDKNPNNRTESRLVVDFSQFSRGDTRVQWPKFAVPNLQALTNLLSCNMSWLSLDVSAAFYHIPLSPAAMPHLLVGSPGLEGLASCMSYRSSERNIHSMQHLHHLCRRDNLLALMLLFKSFGRKLHLLAHSFIMGFRKIPMGVGLSPFLLAQFTSALASVVRRLFPHCLAFTYMDDVVLGARTPQHLESIYASVCSLFSDLGIHLNPDKTKWWGKHLHFMGLEISLAGTLPQSKHQKHALKLLRALPCYTVLDWKILQRLTGLLGFLAPFTACGYPALMPLYNAIAAKSGFQFSPTYKGFLVGLYSRPLPVTRQRASICQVFADATPTGWGLVNHQLQLYKAGRFPRPLPIHQAELIAAALARCWSGAKVLGTDNTIVSSHKLTHYPWLLGCTANWILRGTSFCYVPSEFNPADAPSRGRLGILVAPPPLRFHPSTGRTSLFVVSPPAPTRVPDRVSFDSPVLRRKATWRPP
uniref:Protein P n=1 Tax=Bat Hepatitis B virus TaxID=1401315 RepID=A0A2H5BVH3_HBV|nr:polymerase [Bat Hepatitis B virus]AUG90850.1 polymerase [Bat Hepatitis B virus]